MYKLSKRSYSRLNGIESILIGILTDAIKDSPYDFGIPSSGGFRSAVDQRELFNKGASKCDGYNKRSRHQTGTAFDIYGYVDGKATWDEVVLTEIALHLVRVAKESYDIDLDWGGNWSTFRDMPHYQIR